MGCINFMDRLFPWNEQESECNDSEFTFERVDLNEKSGCPAGWPLSFSIDSYFNLPTQERGKHQPQHHIEQHRQ